MARSCARSNRILRGVIGGVVGGVAGSLVGFGVSVAILRNTVATGAMSLDSALAFAFGPAGIGTVGLGVGATVGAWKPQC